MDNTEDMEICSYAAQLIKDERFIKIIQGLEDEFTQRWKQSVVGEDKEREKIYFVVQALDSIVNRIDSLSNNYMETLDERSE